MAALKDTQERVEAEVEASREDVLNACVRAAEKLGKHAKIETIKSGLVVRIPPGVSSRFSSQSPIVSIRLADSDPDSGKVKIVTKVESYLTMQSKFLMLIPTGPKRLIGKGPFQNLLRALEIELGAVNPGNSTVRRIRPA